MRLNKAAGITAQVGLISVGDDLPGAATAALIVDTAEQISDTANLRVASTGSVQFNGKFEILGQLQLLAGSSGTPSISIASESTIVPGDISLVPLGTPLAGAAAEIHGGTIAILPATWVGAAAVIRLWHIGDAFVGDDLEITSAIVDGSGINATLNTFTKAGHGALVFSGTSANTFTAITTVRDGTLALNKSGAQALAAASITIGDGDFSFSGDRAADSLEIRQSEQLPDYNTPISVAYTGIFALTSPGVTETTGINDFQSLSLAGGGAIAGPGTLRLTGDINVSAGLGGPATISANLDLGTGALRTITTVQLVGSPLMLIVSGNISGSAGLIKTGGGVVRLLGNNTYSGDTFIQGGGFAVSSNMAFGTGMLSASSGTLQSEGGNYSISNLVSLDGNFSLVGGSQLTFSGEVMLTGTRTITITTPVFHTISGPISELGGSFGFVKAGSGFLRLTGENTFSGNVNINQAGGSIIVSGSGRLLNASSIVVNSGTTFTLDNSQVTNNDRIRNAAGVSLFGGTFEFIGNNAGVDETVGQITLNADWQSYLVTNSLSGSSILRAHTIARNNDSSLRIRAYGSAIGTANNRIVVNTLPTGVSGLVNNTFPYALLQSDGGLDFVTYGALGIAVAPFVTSLVGATANDNVKLSASEAINVATTVNALIINANDVNVSGTNPLRIHSGLVGVQGSNNRIATTALDFGANTALFPVQFGSNLTISSVVSGSFGLTKLGLGKLVLSGSNTYAGVTDLGEGIIEIRNGNALGVAANSLSAHETRLRTGAELQISGDISVGEERLNVISAGSGFGQAGLANSVSTFSIGSGGNTGALRSLSGNNIWQGNVAIFSSGLIGVDSGKLSIGSTSSTAGIISGAQLAKVGNGTLELFGNAANTYSGSTIVASGSLILNKLAGLEVNASNRGGAATGVGAIVVGDFIGAADADALVLMQPEQISDAVNVTINSTGKLQTSSLLSNAVQVVTIPTTSTAGATFRLGLNGVFTTQLVHTATPQEVQAALETIPALANNVVVYGTPRNYSIVFRNALAGSAASLLTIDQTQLTTSALAEATVQTVVPGGVLGLESIGGTIAFTGMHSLSPRLDLGGANLVLGGLSATAGNSIFALAPTQILNGSLALSSPIASTTAAPTRSLVIGDSVATEDFIISANVIDGGVIGGSLIRAGLGRGVMSGANTYSGQTTFQQGEWDITRSEGLGAAAANEVQTVTLTGATGGNYRLTFGSDTTAPIPFNASAAAIESALNAGIAIQAAGSVAVSQFQSNVYLVRFLSADLDVSTIGTASSTLTGRASPPTISITSPINGGASNAGTSMFLQTSLRIGGNATLADGFSQSNVLLGTSTLWAAGMIRSLSGNNVLTGPINFSTSIGVEANSTLDIRSVISGPGFVKL
ncbi:MAG: autotransporter-associated beta strand repeat-containing protein, partial [Planctomycetaceae bacterium]|nr:autotransporter-associated beta strand repeat-containing protein [Planctomycetaceae bacterium]